MVKLIDPFGILYNEELCDIGRSCVGVRMVKCSRVRRLDLWLMCTYKECVQNFGV